jgi:signal transduction histidine kinase
MTTTSHREALKDAAVVVAAVSIAFLHAAIPEPLLQHLLYLPIIYAGIRHGWPGGLGMALVAALCDSPVRYWEIATFCSAGNLAGLLAERKRKQKRISEETVQRFERMKHAEGLYALGQLSAGLAHEIRNPLASIAGAVGILRRGHSSPEKAAECLEIIHKECQRLNRMLTSFLDYARPRSPNFLTISMDSVFDSVLGLAGHAVNGAAVSLRRQSDPGLMLDCDPEQLKQVLLNLVINAIQAMPDGGEVVMASRAEGGKAIIEVRDQGCGAGEEQMKHLYDPFFTTKENGTGLGLPVAHQIVAHLGGVLSARNNPDRGMTFTVELPLSRQPVQ